MKIKTPAILILLSAFSSFLCAQSGDLKPADIFSDGMVIQKDYDLPIWGEDNPGRKIRVSIAGQELSTTADKDGKWKVTAAAIKTAGPFQLDIQSESGKVSVKDIVCGEVWVMAGESVIGMNLDKGAPVASDPEKPSIRYFRAPRQISRTPYSNLPGSWRKCEAGTEGIPAVAYYFADEIRNRLNVHVGIIVCSVPDSISQAWGVKDCLKGIKQLAYPDDYQELIQNYEMKISGTFKGLQEIGGGAANEGIKYAGSVKRFQLWATTAEGRKIVKTPAESDQWQEKIQDWVENSMQRESRGVPVSEEEKAWPLMIQIASGVVADPRTSGVRPAGIFNGMINPLIPFAIRGFVYWQGETDASWERGALYYQILTAVVKSWRGVWQKAQPQKKGDLPFVIMQLQGVGEDKGISAEECSLLRLSQAAVQEKLNTTAIAISYDIIPGPEKDSIPMENLREAGHRLAVGAFGKAYAQKITWSGPLFDSVAVGESSLKLKFRFADSGMVAGRNGAEDKVRGFEIGDPDGSFKPAEAVIEKNFVILKAPGVITAVRYGWGLKPDANLYNKEGLPAIPFSENLSDK